MCCLFDFHSLTNELMNCRTNALNQLIKSSNHFLTLSTQADQHNNELMTTQVFLLYTCLA